MKKKQRILLGIVAFVLLLVGIFGAELLVGKKPLRATLAEIFNVAPDMLHINLPPATGRYPGAVFVSGQQRLLPIEFSSALDNRLRRGSPIALSIELDEQAFSESGLNSGFFEQLANSGKTTSMSVYIEEVVPVEMTGGNIKELLLASESAKNASLNNTPVYVISKAYEGRLRVVLHTSSNASAKAVVKDVAAAMPNTEASIEASGTEQERVSVAFSDHTVFAYELMEASFFSTSLSIEPSEVVLTSVRPPVLSDQGRSSPEPEDTQTGPIWGLLTLASGIYPNQPTWNQPWNATSAGAVASELARLKPAFNQQFYASTSEPLTKTKAERVVEQSIREASNSNLDFLLVYFVGHMIRRSDGEFALLTADDTAKTIQDPLSDALTVRSLYEWLDSSGRPFALLIDGCMLDSQIDEFRRSLGFVLPARYGHMNYIGPAEFITDELSQYADALDDAVATHDYLHTNNPVVLGSKPGTVAPGIPDPLNAWGGLHGPLADKLVRLARVVASNHSNRPVQELVRSTVDFNGAGQLTAGGTISWSDFSSFDSAGVAKETNFETNGTVLNNEAFVGIDRLTPFSDDTGFWVHDFNGDIWRWQMDSNERKRVVSQEPFTEIVSLAEKGNYAIYDA